MFSSRIDLRSNKAENDSLQKYFKNIPSQEKATKSLTEIERCKIR